ncbi:hypothetical protein [Luteipulveratus halotolerans]|nr:hypothetical protein [Luteipulveratus halotolerans]
MIAPESVRNSAPEDEESAMAKVVKQVLARATRRTQLGGRYTYWN